MPDSVISTTNLLERATTLLEQSQQAGLTNFDGHIPSKAEHKLREEILNTLPEIEHRIENGTASDITALDEIYDLLYRIGHRRATDRDMRARYFRRAMTLWLGGDHSATEEDLAGMLVSLYTNPALCRSIDFKYIQWLSGVLDRWIAIISEHGTFPGLSPATTYQRLAILISANLRAYYPSNQDEIKLTWLKSHLHPAPDTLSPLALTHYTRLLHTAEAINILRI